MAISAQAGVSPLARLTASYDRERLEDVGFLTSMTLVLLGNYAQTGHFGGPLAYTPYNVATHLAGPALGGAPYRPSPSEENDWARRGYRYVSVKIPGLSYPYYSFLLRNDRGIADIPPLDREP